MANYKMYHGIAYFPNIKDAEKVKDELKADYPEARVVNYTRGWAVQYYKSGPYYPEVIEMNPRKAFEQVLSKEKVSSQMTEDKIKKLTERLAKITSKYEEAKRVFDEANEVYKKEMKEYNKDMQQAWGTNKD